MKKLMVFYFFFFCFFILTNHINALARDRAEFLKPDDNDVLLPGVNFALIYNPSAYNISLYGLAVSYDDGFWELAEASYTGINFREVIAIPFDLKPGHGQPLLIFTYINQAFGEGHISQEVGLASGDENSLLFENSLDQTASLKTLIPILKPRKPIYSND